MLNIKNVKAGHARAKNKKTHDFNCWGATLYALGKIEKLKWINQESMKLFLYENTVLQSEELKRGDILVLKNKYGTLEHTAVYIGRKLFWHKRGSNHSELAYIDEVKKVYKNCIDDTKTEIRRLKERDI